MPTKTSIIEKAILSAPLITEIAIFFITGEEVTKSSSSIGTISRVIYGGALVATLCYASWRWATDESREPLFANYSPSAHHSVWNHNPRPNHYDQIRANNQRLSNMRASYRHLNNLSLTAYYGNIARSRCTY